MIRNPDVDSLETSKSRADWMRWLSRAPASMLTDALNGHIPDEPLWLRKPETGLMMVKGRIGGNGESFNLGEITVTRCAIKIKDTQQNERVGIAYVLGRSKRLAFLASVGDALLQDPSQQNYWLEKLIKPVKHHILLIEDQKNKKAQETKVDFFTVAREAGSQTS
jgi:alpha-D-ribose 1-methylphosphonate 5-triphosphate synthase subunit PhnG